MKDTIDILIDEFNETVGGEEGIIINVTSITSSATIYDKLRMAVNDEPGAPDLPDITTLYPNTAYILAEKAMLADLGSYFSLEDLSLYISEFVEEGRLPDGNLYVLPIGKSTEVIFLNTSIFNRFMKDTGVDCNDLYTFEGILKIAEKYYEWTDDQTPAVKNDGKAFINYDSLFNLAQTIYKQAGEDLIIDGNLNLSSPAFKDLWKNYFEPAVKGYVSIYDGYGSDLIKTGSIAANIGSTAGVLFYSDMVTYEDNTTEHADFLILPYPVIDGGEKVAIQRGGGMCVIKSNEAKEHAAAIFLKWFTSPEQNIRFVSSTGYIPVTEKAVEMTDDKIGHMDDKMRSLENATKEMAETYNFFYTPVIDDFEVLEDSFNRNLKEWALVSRNEYLDLLYDMDKDDAFAKACQNKFEEFVKQR